ncbi:MAG: DUF4442 domain-containing protein [Tahibacter sp.]
MSPNRLRRVMNIWPPFLFSGIRVLSVSTDWRHARVRLKRTWYNQNYVRAHFGGSLFAMTDPFWMILMMECLGRDYVVWDQAASIEFIAPGREDVFAQFDVSESMLDELRAATDGGEKCLRWFETEIRTGAGELIARVRKQIYVRRKKRPSRVDAP